MIRRAAPRGVTVIELVVVLAILGVLASVAPPAFRSEVGPEAASDVIRRLRVESRRTGRAASDTTVLDGAKAIVTAWPTGLVLLDPAVPSGTRSGADAK